jgi:hypothetical protein
MTLKEHIKKQREECLKYEVKTKEHEEHWELLNYLCEVIRLREENSKLINLAIKKGVFKDLE